MKADLLAAARPVIIIGEEFRYHDFSRIAALWQRIQEKYRIPIVRTFEGVDIPVIPGLDCGRMGTIGHRSANLIVQNADFILMLGAHMNIRMISQTPELFGRGAKKAMVSVDSAELLKPTLPLDYPLQTEIAGFLMQLDLEPAQDPHRYDPWWDHINLIIRECSYFRTEFYKLPTAGIDINTDILVAANGFASIATYHSLPTYPNIRVLMNSGTASMGWALSAAIGAWFAAPDRRIVCIEGDGSLMMNLAEIAVLAQYRIPLHLIINCNHGYQSIIETQKTMRTPLFGSTTEHLQFPSFRRFWDSLVLPSDHLHITQIWPDGYVCKCASFFKDGRWWSRPLEDMSPYLPRETLKKLMLIPLAEASLQEVPE